MLVTFASYILLYAGMAQWPFVFASGLCVIAGAEEILITLVMIWSPPAELHGWLLVGWMAVGLLLYETAQTAFVVPYGALGMEITDGHTRTGDTRTFLAGQGCAHQNELTGLTHATLDTGQVL